MDAALHTEDLSAVRAAIAHLSDPEIPVVSLSELGILRGVVFSKRHTVYVGTASVAGFLGISLYPFFGNMAANGAFAALSDGTFENVILTVQPLTFIVAATGPYLRTSGKGRRPTASSAPP